MDDIRTLGRQSLQLFEQFIAGARSVITEEGLSAAGATAKIKEQQERLVHETREVLQTFRTKVTHKEQELKAILHPARQDLVEQAREALRKVYQIIEQLSMKDKMVHRWVEQSASALVADYQGALSDGDMTKIEVFESEAEQYLAEKGDLEATSNFLALRAESEDSQLSPDQKKAKADLTELERIKEQVAVVVSPRIGGQGLRRSRSFRLAAGGTVPPKSSRSTGRLGDTAQGGVLSRSRQLNGNQQGRAAGASLREVFLGNRSDPFLEIPRCDRGSRFFERRGRVV